jgi:cobalt-precorrin 5A hydrolase/precorrin-3B C17-methyltransferase
MKVLAVSVTARGRALAARLPYEHHEGHAADTVAARWQDVDGFVLFLATGAAVRIIAPLLTAKHRDPAVVCVDEAGRFAVALCGGHGGGANDLACDVARQLGAEAVVTTATDAIGIPALDQLPGFTATGDIAAVTVALLDGGGDKGVRVANPRNWPVPLTDDPAGRALVTVTDNRHNPEPGHAALHPLSLVAGIGTSTDAQPRDVASLLAETLAAAGLAPESIAEVATIDRRAAATAIVALGHRIRAFDAEQLARVAVPTPSEAVRAAVGTPSVCEAAALLAAGPGGELVVTKRTSRTATVAIARRAHPRGQLSVVGLGPGTAGHRTPAATTAVRRAELVIGYRAYIEQCRELLGPAQQVVTSPIGEETVRAKQALAEAGAGRRVALVCSGDAGTYAMASIVLELADGSVDVDVIPGVAAATAAAAVLGAPLGHDHCAISLSDLLTSWDVIERRVRAAAEADLVVAFYNPRSVGRTWQLPAARQILLEHRAATTPVGLVTDAGRTTEAAAITTLGDLDTTSVGMTTCVIIGATTTRVVNGRMVTPRGYQ